MLSVSCHHRRRQYLSFPTRRSSDLAQCRRQRARAAPRQSPPAVGGGTPSAPHRGRGATGGTSQRLSARALRGAGAARSEEHTSELQSRENLVCRLLLETKKL